MRLYIFFTVLILMAPIPCISVELVIDPEEVKDFDESTGAGCLIEEEKGGPDIVSIVCKSKRSADFAWNAVMARSKFRCESAGKSTIQMLFLKPPSLPVKNGIFTAQMDIKCRES